MRAVVVAAALTIAGASSLEARSQAVSPPPPPTPLMVSWCGAGSWDPAGANRILVDGQAASQITFAGDAVAGVAEVSVDPLAFPTVGATFAVVLSIVTTSTNARDSSLSATVSVKGGANQVPPGRGVDCFSSEAPAPSLRLLLPGGFDGTVTVTKLDPTTAAAAISLERVPLRRDDQPATEAEVAKDEHPWFVGGLSQGHAFRATLTASKYQELVAYARCEYLNAAERARGCATAENQTQKAKAIYDWLSQILGRSPVDEYATRRGSRTEPIIVFFGLANTNRSALLDCRTISDIAGEHVGRFERFARGMGQPFRRHRDTGLAPRCIEYSEPWQTSLQRAEYAWAVYLEDELTGFDTAIDIEFKSRAPDVDYEDFDPRAPVQLPTIRRVPTEAARGPQAEATPASARPDVERRTIRVGYRRFRIREAPTAVQVAFTRQGPTYGARQYQRVYRKRSSRAITVAGTIFVAATPIDVEDARHLAEEPPPGFGEPTLGRIAPEIGHAWVFTAVSLRWPTARARAGDQPNWYSRLAWNGIPDFTAGLALRRDGNDPYLIGGSWPLWTRLYVTAGLGLVKEDVLRPGYRASQLLPLDSAGFTESRWRRRFMFGASIDLIDSR